MEFLRQAAGRYGTTAPCIFRSEILASWLDGNSRILRILVRLAEMDHEMELRRKLPALTCWILGQRTSIQFVVGHGE